MVYAMRWGTCALCPNSSMWVRVLYAHIDVASHLEAKSQVSYFVVGDGEIAKRVGEVRMTKHLADRRDVASVRIDVRGFGPPQ